MIALFGLLTVIVLSVVVVRIGAIALELTGLSRDVAAFQAQSAFSGVGFTTSESEFIVSHPVRRRVVRILMLLGSVGITSTVATLILTFVGQTGEAAALRLLILSAGLLAIWVLASSEYVYRATRGLIVWTLDRWTSLRIYDYEQLLGLGHGYTISRITVKSDSWMSRRQLRDLKLDLEGVLVLAIYRKVGDVEKFIGAPNGDTVIEPGDVLICYGRKDACISLSQRFKGTAGDLEHQEQIEKELHLARLREARGGFDA
ncbi:MAG: PhoU and TrkA_C domains protein [Candidatus Alkanophagales archaeon MCA70_species_2]|nr:PhoU and TrkA_C domains protein [Candidatus Alkanophaga liquidiphilum]